MSIRLYPNLGFGALVIWTTIAGPAYGQTPAPPTPQPSAAPATADPLPPVPPEVVRRDEFGRVSIRAVRATDPIHVDGRLDEAIYQATKPIDGFIQQEPREGEPASERTEAWVLFDDQNVYISARCFDSQPDRMVVNEMRRDHGNIYQNENFTVALDTYHDRRNGYYFQVSAIGALRDGLITDEGNPNYDWNAVYDARVVRSDLGYTVEMVIPFKSLRYNAGAGQVWGINLRRTVRWKNEDMFITRMPASYGSGAIYKFSSAATLVGLETPTTSRNLELKPYAISDVRTDRTATPLVSNDLGANAGFDAKYGLSRSLTADFTYNTDFAQVEDDEQQVNLTRFSLYFPEKREFFLEGQGIFNFGGGGGRGGGLAPVFFFSRRIGLAGGQPVPIRAGGRVTGRAGKFTLGLLNIETGRTDRVAVEPTNFSVVRIRRDILRRSTIGFIGSNRSIGLSGSGSGQAFGVDANFAFYENISFSGYYARTRSPEQGPDDVSYQGSVSYNADRYGFSYQNLVVGENFSPDIGFVRRSDFQRHFASARFSPRPKQSRVVRKLFYETSFDYIANRDGTLETREAQASFSLERQNSDRLSVEYSNSYEYLAEPFTISTGVTLPIGGYDFQTLSASYNLGTQHRVSGTPSVSLGTFYDGTKSAVGYSGRVEVTNRLSVEPRISLNLVDLPEGRFTTNVTGARTTLSFSPRTFLSALLQYNSSSHAFTTNVRLKWEYQPGSEVYVVYSEGRDTDPRGFPELQNRGLVVKATRLFRF